MRRQIRCVGRGHASNSLPLNINTLTSQSISQEVEIFKNVIITCPFLAPQLLFELIPTKNLQSSESVLYLCVPVRDLTWKDLDLIVERAQVPQYQKGPMDVITPVLYGLMLGFGGTLIAGVSIFFTVVYICGRNNQPKVWDK